MSEPIDAPGGAAPYDGPYRPASHPPAYASPQPYGQPFVVGTEQPVFARGSAVQSYPRSPAWGQPAVMHHHRPAAPQWGTRSGFTLVSPGGRLGAVVLDVLLIMVTLGIGWFVWALIAWSKGQTPGKQVLGHVVADASTGEQFTWSQMFLRDFLIRGLLFGLISTVTAGLFGLVDVLMVFREDRRTLHDQMAGSIV